MLLRSALIYLLADVPVQLTGFLTFGSCVGVKNFLPATLGLLFGPWGAIGGCVGCAAGALLLGTPVYEALLECICILVIGVGMWLLWHLGSTTHRIHFKRPINYLKYLGLLVGLSAIAACACFVLPGMRASFSAVFFAHLSMGLLVGIPVNILFNGLLSIEPVLPPWYSVNYPVSGAITSDPQTLAAFNEALEDFSFSRKLNMKRLFEIQNCVEELSIRILAAQPDAKIEIRMNYDDTFSARLSYPGAKHNPLRTSKDEDELDVMGLKLIKHRALRAAYSYKQGENRILIVL